MSVANSFFNGNGVYRSELEQAYFDDVGAFESEIKVSTQLMAKELTRDVVEAVKAHLEGVLRKHPGKQIRFIRNKYKTARKVIL